MVGRLESLCLLLQHGYCLFGLQMGDIFAFLLPFLFDAEIVNQSAVVFILVLKSKQSMFAVLQFAMQLLCGYSRLLCGCVPGLKLHLQFSPFRSLHIKHIPELSIVPIIEDTLLGVSANIAGRDSKFESIECFSETVLCLFDCADDDGLGAARKGRLQDTG